MSGLYVPDDWTEATDGFCTLSITVPNSSLWRSSLRGAVFNLADTDYWDADTGDADQAAQIGLTVFNSLSFDCP